MIANFMFGQGVSMGTMFSEKNLGYPRPLLLLDGTGLDDFSEARSRVSV